MKKISLRASNEIIQYVCTMRQVEYSEKEDKNEIS